MTGAWTCYGCDQRGIGDMAEVDRAAEKHTKAAGHPTATFTPAPEETP